MVAVRVVMDFFSRSKTMRIEDSRVYRLGVEKSKTKRLLKQAMDDADKAIAGKNPDKARRILEVARNLKEHLAELERLISEDSGDDPYGHLSDEEATRKP